MAKKPAPKKAAKPAKKAAKPAPKKVGKAAPKKAVKAAKGKPAPKKTVSKALAKKKVAAKPAPKKSVKPSAGKNKAVVKKAIVKKPVAKKPAPKKVVAKPAPVKKAAAKPVAKVAPVKPAPKPAPVKAVSKPAPKPPAPAPKAAKPAPAPKPVKQANVKKEAKEAAAAAANKPLVTQVSVPNRPMAPPVVKKQVSTLESADKVRYSDDELAEFKDLIIRKLDEARKDYDLLKQTLANTDNNGTDDTSPSFKMIEDGSETLSREETAQLAARQEKFIKHLEDALLRILNKTYGICRVTGRLISKERLRLVPHATLSIEAKQQMNN
jgi:RNA polymerase-binding transcription factor DksA